MNFNFYLFGTLSGYNQYPFDTQSRLFEDFAQNCQGNSQLIIYHKNELIYYTYLRYGLQSKSRNKGAYFGISMVFNSVCFYDVKGIFTLFDELYRTMVLKGEILREQKNEKTVFAVKKFFKKQAEIGQCKAFLQKGIDNHFSRIDDYTKLDASFNQTNNTPKAISINDVNSNIIDDVIRKFCHVVIISQKNDAVSTQDFKNAIRKKYMMAAIFFLITLFAIYLFVLNPVLVEPESQKRISNYEIQSGVYTVHQKQNNSVSSSMYAEVKEYPGHNFYGFINNDLGQMKFNFVKNKDGKLYSEQLGIGVMEYRNSSGIERFFLTFTDKNNNIVWEFSK